MTFTYLIRPAHHGDIDPILTLRIEAERWLAAAGIRQWTSDYTEYAHGILATWVASGAAWVVEPANDPGNVVGTVSINTVPDDDFWGWLPSKTERDAALYLGKMIVARAHAGRHLGDAILNWATQRALLAGRTWVRLDVRRDNIALQDYYLRRGFVHLRTWHRPERRTESGWLAQRHVTVTTGVHGLVLVEQAKAGTRTGNFTSRGVGAA